MSLSLSLVGNMSLTGKRFTPARLFTSAEAGAWYDPSDLSTLWQDTAGTSPVTADGQAVARIDDKSGNGHHLTQATAANRPLYKTAGGIHWLEFDGTNDALSVVAAGLRLVGDLTLSAGIYKNGGSSWGPMLVCEETAGANMPYEWRLSNSATVVEPQFLSADAASGAISSTSTVTGAFATPLVIGARRDVGATIEHSVNKTRAGAAYTQVPAGGTSTFVMGSRTALDIFLAGRIYGAVIHGSTLSDTDLSRLETWLGTKSGLTL